jgi:ATP-dependent Clp protease ATP-binding subunit ClpC
MPIVDRFDKFTDLARRVLQLAREEAQHFDHNYIGTEHLLLGLVRVQEGVGARVLAELGVELNRVRSAVEFVVGRGDRNVAGDIGLTPRAKKVIELAIDTARQLNRHGIGTEPVLLGLVREGEGIGAGVLESLGVTMERTWTRTLDVLAVPPDQRPPRPPPTRLPESPLNVARQPSEVGQSGVMRGSIEPAVRFDRFTEPARLVV